MENNLNITYNPKDFEEKIYKMWEENGYFTPEINSEKKPFTIVMPPPNITGALHLGHAIDNTLQDILIRIKRMQGYSALWLPGEDHASIATEIRVEKELLKDGIKKKELGREKFLEKVWEWSGEYRERIKTQLKKMGASADFTREAFTMDENLNKAVRHVFVKLYNEGLIYKGNRITNWCPKCMTALSDAEINYVESEGAFYHVNYPIKDSDEYIEIATTRPETILGDTGVCVNPKDERYKHLIGKTCILPLIGREIPIVGDEYADMEMGTGALKVTPAHDPNDYLIGKRHNLEEINVLHSNGTINKNGGKYEGKDRFEVRKEIVKDLEEAGFLVKIQKINHNVSLHDRCETSIEPLITSQWYVKMKPLAEPAIDIVKTGEIKFVPERFDKIYYNWMENIEDWCISRQLWWGHRIPVWYCEDCGEIICQEEAPNECPKCKSKALKQDEDVLDTWFSSALWPFSTLGWPDKTEDLEYFYPTDVLVTAYDIIFFWVARMIFSGLHNMKEIPFHTVLIHGIIRDSQGRKMSKSLGNGVDPLEIIEKYGADALRFMLVTGNSPGNDMRFLVERVEAARNFGNKIWNASRYVIMNLEENLLEKYKDCKNYNLSDKWILTRMNEVISEVTENFEKYEIGIALSKLYDFIWTEYCDWYIELSKPVLYGDNEEQKGVTLNVLKSVLVDMLKLLHPVMPFITEEIYSKLNSDEAIIISSWPVVCEEKIFTDSKEKMEYIIDGIKSIRNARSEMNVPPSKKAKTYIREKVQDVFLNSEKYFEKLAGASEIIFTNEDDFTEEMVSIVSSGANIYIPLLELIDREVEIERLNKEKTKLEGEIKRVENKLSNEKFISKAPKEVVDEEREKGDKYKKMLESVLTSLSKLS